MSYLYPIWSSASRSLGEKERPSHTPDEAACRIDSIPDRQHSRAATPLGSRKRRWQISSSLISATVALAHQPQSEARSPLPGTYYRVVRRMGV